MRRTTMLRTTLAILFLVTGPLLQHPATIRAQAGDDEETYLQLLDEAQDRPRVFGPEDGDMLHSAEGDLVIAPVPESLSLQDIAVHAVFTNPYDVSENSFDYGIGFRVNDNGFYWVGVIAGLDDGPAWLHSFVRDQLIAVENFPDLDQTAGGTNTLDLIAIGDTGYLGINGEFVTTLDLSQHQEAGGIALGTTFVTDAFLEGETTGYADFTVWSFDDSTTTDPTPTRTPRTGGQLPTPRRETPETDPTEEIEPTPDETPVETGVDGNTYTSPTYRYSLEWDDTWSVLEATVADLDDDETDNDQDVLILTNEVSEVTISGYQTDETAEDCIANAEAFLEDLGVEPEIAIDTEGTPITDSDSSFGYAVYTVTLPGGDDPGGDAWYVECRLFDPDIMVRSEQIVPTDSYNDELDPRADLLNSLNPPAEREPTEEPTEEPTRTPSPTRTPLTEATVEPTDEPTEEPSAEPSASSGGDTVGIKIDEVDGSGVTGLATLSANGDQTEVKILALGAPAGTLILIHEGTCDNLSPAPAFLLRDLDASGSSVTTVSATLTDLREGGYAIAFHEGVDDLSQPLACGEIPAA